MADNKNTQTTLSAEHITALAAASMQQFDVHGTPCLIIPEGFKLEAMPELMPRPARTQEAREVLDVPSFIEYFNKFKQADETIIFASEATRKITAIFDYHTASHPAHADHSLKLNLIHSDEWKKWTSIDRKTLTQRELAEFIEDNLQHIQEPAAAELLEIAKTLQATKKLNFRQSQELSNGQVQLTFHEEVNGQAGAAGQLSIPKEISVGLRIFKGQQPYKVTFRFRYKVDGEGTLSFALLMNNKETLLEDAFTTVVNEIEQALNIKAINT